MDSVFVSQNRATPTRIVEALGDVSRTVCIGLHDTPIVSILRDSSSLCDSDDERALIRDHGDGGGLRSLFAHIVRATSIEGRYDESGVTFSISTEVARWMLGHRFLIRMLAAAWDADPPEQIVSDAIPEGRGSAYLLQYEYADRSPILRLLVEEPVHGDGGTSTPSRSLGSAIARQRNLVSLLVGADVRLRSRSINPGGLDWGRRLPTFITGRHTVILHPPSLERFARLFGNGRVSVPFTTRDEQLFDLRILDAVLRRDGLSEVILVAPTDGPDRRARFAIRTCIELVRAGGVVTRTLVDETYRNGAAYDRALAMTLGFGENDLNTLRHSYGQRRWSQIVRHADYRRGGAGELPWVRFVSACESLCSELSERSRRPGYAPPSPVVEIVNRYYRTPRRTILEHVWRRQIDDGALHDALDQARLSILRAYLRSIPRVVLLRAACGEASFVRERLSSAYGRRGRRIFDEDLLALEARVDRKEFEDWEALLAARATVFAAARRA